MKNLFNKGIELYKKYKEVINYLIFGGLTTVVSMVSYFIFTRVFGIDEVVSSAISWFCAVTFAYITNKIWVFESKTNTVGSFFKEAVMFYLARVASGALCDVGTFALMVKALHINDVIAKVITQVMVVIVNYVFSKLIVFRKKKEK